MQFNLITSQRRTISIIIKRGELTLRAPLGTSKKDAEKFIESKIDWVNKNLKKSIEKARFLEVIFEKKEDKPSKIKVLSLFFYLLANVLYGSPDEKEGSKLENLRTIF